MGQCLDSVIPQEVDIDSGVVRRSSILQESPWNSVRPEERSATPDGLPEPGQNVLVDEPVDPMSARDEFTMDDSMSVKEDDQHAFGDGDFTSDFLWSLLSLCQPLLGVFF